MSKCSAFSGKQWEKMLPIDSPQGVELLAWALYQRLDWLTRWAIHNARASEENQKLSETLGWSELLPRSTADEDVRRLKAFRREFGELLYNEELAQEAEKATVFSFRWKWHHFRDFPILISHAKPNLPAWASDAQTPIARRPDDKLTYALTEVLRTVLDGEKFEGDPRDDADWAIYWATFELHEPPRGRGHPEGRRWADGMQHVIAGAWSLLDEARRTGKRLSKERAIQLALDSFKIVTSPQFDFEEDKEACLVVNAGASEAERRSAAAKLIRKELDAQREE